MCHRKLQKTVQVHSETRKYFARVLVRCAANCAWQEETTDHPFRLSMLFLHYKGFGDTAVALSCLTEQRVISSKAKQSSIAPLGSGLLRYARNDECLGVY